jgi:pimeloyl-ACP methyl ester carboxylesterase
MMGMSHPRRRAKVVVKLLLFSAIVVLAAGVIYEQSGRRHDLDGIARVGRAVDIGGRSLNINCVGDGGPTVVLDSGANNPGYAWLLVQPKIAQFSNVCWYDRAGNGWSDGGPFPRTSGAIARDLHALLGAAGVRPPYVLVGHSFGGTSMRVFNGLYPAEVAGMVLVDAWHEDEMARLPRHKGPGPPDFLRPALDAMTPAFYAIGLFRLFRPPIRIRPPLGLTSDQWLTMQRLRRQPKAMAAESSSGMTQDQSADQVRQSAGLGDRPLVVLTAGKAEFDPSDPKEAREATEDQEVWIHELQAQFVRLSSRGKQVVIANSAHGIPWEAPDAVADAVREVVTIVRANAAARFCGQRR